MKDFIHKILDMPKFVRTIWFILWLMLAILLILKFCFGMWFPIIVKNQWFINLCDFVDANPTIYKIVSGTFYVMSLNFLSLTCMGKKKYDSILFALIVNLVIIISFLLKIYNSLIGNIFEILFLFIAYCFVNMKQKNFIKTWQNIAMPIIVYLVINVWQLSIYLVRSINLDELKNYSALIGLVLMFDYYIFIIILWIGGSYMSWWSAGWLFGKTTTELRALREIELGKEKPDTKLIAKIDEAIAKKENERK